jgi:hypothetical protein
MNPDEIGVILARVSTKGQEDEGYSLEAQVKNLRMYCTNTRINPIKVFKIAESASKTELSSSAFLQHPVSFRTWRRSRHEAGSISCRTHVVK